MIMAVKKPTVRKAPAKKPVVKKAPAKKAAAARNIAGLEKKIGKVPKFFKELTETEPEMFNMVMRFEKHIWDDGALTKQTKKLIAIAIAAALRDQHAVRAQLAGAANLGVTKKEVEEALRVTFLLSGMPAYVYGKAQLDEVMK
jgi:alkylhydroperoxidase/carboxymuconolactone decarboxylase family protein YurZ